MAYAEKKLIPSKASAGGCYTDGVASYTATVLNAAKSLGKGLRELTEQVAAGLTGHPGGMAGVGALPSANINADGSQPGIVTILDIKNPIKDISPTSGTPVTITGNDPIVAHFVAHAEAVTAMSFDPSGMLLLTADRRGHDFNVYRIQPHPSGSVLAAAHHLYVLHRGDTSAKVQDITFSFDSRWVAVSSLRGTTHVFPITPYGGQPGYRTHSGEIARCRRRLPVADASFSLRSSPCREPLVTLPSLCWVNSRRSLKQPNFNGRAHGPHNSLREPSFASISTSNCGSSVSTASPAIKLELSLVTDFSIIAAKHTSGSKGTNAHTTTSSVERRVALKAAPGRRCFRQASLVAVGSAWIESRDANSDEPHGSRLALRNCWSWSSHSV